MNEPRKIILASSSPRRKELLTSMGLSFDVIPSDADEEVPGNWPPEKMVEVLAERKAMQVAEKFPGSIVIGADTIVWLDGEVLGKPRNEEEAFAMLSGLQGRIHRVYSGLAVLNTDNGLRKIGHRMTIVQMKQIPADRIRRYIASGEPLDKAGAYAIQGIGATFIEGIEGDYFNVVGLPLSLLADFLLEFGISMPG